VTGASGADGTFQVGDTISVSFTLKNRAGKNLLPSEMDFLGMMVSGPTTNYQRVVAEQFDVAAKATANGDGTWTYKFASPIPAAYLAPLNDTDAFGPDDGELTGQNLQPGTYTVGFEGYKAYLVQGTTYRDAMNATQDFLFGGATTLAPREVVKVSNCNQCHNELRAHGTIRRDTKLCVLCHTAGAEDRNTPSVEGGTPGVTIDFRVMVHKIHMGKHLPSVLGVGTKDDGSRDYTLSGKPYRIIGFGDNVLDFSDVSFPAWPNLDVPMPRDSGYGALDAASKAKDDAIRTGPTACALCHGDPDGDGPLTAPAQGDNAYTKPSRQACGACHDDLDFTKPYVSNDFTMPANLSNASCANCHQPAGTVVSIADAHTHPLYRTNNPGLNVTVTQVAEAGNNNGNGNIDVGEKIAVTFTLQDSAGANVPPSALTGINGQLNLAVTGPTTARQMLAYYTPFPVASLGATADSYTVNVPEIVYLELVGTATPTAGEVFTVARTPIWTAPATLTSVWVRGADGAASTLTAATAVNGVPQNYIDVASGGAFSRNNFIVIDDGVSGKEEYMQVQSRIGNRLWFSSPYTPAYPATMRFAHDAGATVKVVTLAVARPGSYAVNGANGTITEASDTGFRCGTSDPGTACSGKVIATYTTDFVLPAVYGLPPNSSPDFDAKWGKWAGRAMQSGTYTVALWGYRSFCVGPRGNVATVESCNATLSGAANPTFNPDNTSYRGTSREATMDFLVGDATAPEPWAVISSGDNCNRCHQDLMFHGGSRRGFNTCANCHTLAGAEDRPQYVAGAAPATPGVAVDFRQMLHRIHMGADLEDQSYQVVGFGASAFPNNFGVASYGDVEFPALNGGARACEMCHGADNTRWKEPADRPFVDPATGAPSDTKTRVWGPACTGCHNADHALAHVDLQTTTLGAEACGACHEPGTDFNVELMHKKR
jgi:OmcA/MtrC family decaheme c-type cytochrome